MKTNNLRIFYINSKCRLQIINISENVLALNFINLCYNFSQIFGL